jgi:hypothetical protein
MRRSISAAATRVQRRLVASFPARGTSTPTKLSAMVPRKAAEATRSAPLGLTHAGIRAVED